MVSIQMKWILEIPKCIYIYMYHTHIYVSYIIVSLSSKQMKMSTAAKIIPVCCYTKLRKIHTKKPRIEGRRAGRVEGGERLDNG